MALCLLLSYALFFSGTMCGQSGRRGTPETINKASQKEDEAVVRVETEEVVLPVSVRNAAGRPVPGLVAEDFLIYDNGIRHEVLSFNQRRVAANIVLLLDASGSVFSQMRFIRSAAKNFASNLGKEDRVCVMQFADRVELLQDWIGASEAEKIGHALDWKYHPGERTTFHDGLYLAAEDQLRKVEGRRIIILLTDGIDTAEHKHASFNDALGAVRRVEASVYVVSLTASLRAVVEGQMGGRLSRLLAGGYARHLVTQYLGTINAAEKLLEQIAETTGGRIFLPIEKEDLLPAYTAIAEELRTQYIVTYKPKVRAQAGEWRALRVLVVPGGYQVATRTGYTGRALRRAQ
ncbi:MAG: VWA domain-containing protein [Pyrinomonadaceae bacterium]|nr:VWA domain-containing protein [Pyrinomonadaceae bacterium]